MRRFLPPSLTLPRKGGGDKIKLSCLLFPPPLRGRVREGGIVTLALSSLMLLTAPASAADAVAVLQGLDKVTARVSTFEAPIGRPVSFGTLEITVKTCRKRPPEEPPESAAFLDISEQRPGEAPIERFSGWMFASSPGLNGLEHPVYDVWVLDCRAAAS